MSDETDRPWLVTGGAGYIGGHVVQRLTEAGQRVVVVDDLSTGDAGRLSEGVPLLRSSVADTAALQAFMERERPIGVIHLAAKKSPAESVANPLLYAAENTGGLIALLSAMKAGGVRHLVFSSSCSVYGDTTSGTITETAPLQPVSPYGESKAYGERLLEALSASEGLRTIALRYFNVAGTASARLQDRSGVSLVPNVLRAAADGTPVKVFGTDYSTSDGTCVRDYVDVRDLADAHAAAAAAIGTGPSYRAYNVGTGAGASVLQVIEAAERVTGRRVVRADVDRRPGDPAVVVAAIDRIARELDWRARYPLHETIASAWDAVAQGETDS